VYVNKDIIGNKFLHVNNQAIGNNNEHVSKMLFGNKRVNVNNHNLGNNNVHVSNYKFGNKNYDVNKKKIGNKIGDVINNFRTQLFCSTPNFSHGIKKNTAKHLPI